MNANDFREEFSTTARRQKMATRGVKRLIGPLLCFALLTVPVEYRQIGITGVEICLVLILGFLLILPKPICPSCKKSPKQPVKTYCPECGTQPLEKRKGIFPHLFCKFCVTKFFDRRIWRRYKIRYCTHCGASLDDDGF